MAASCFITYVAIGMAEEEIPDKDSLIEAAKVDNQSSVTGNDSISKVTGIPIGVASVTMGRGEAGQTGGTAGQGFGSGSYGSDCS